MTLNKYRGIDLFILTVIMCLLEGVCLYGLNIYNSEFAISVVIIVTLIGLMRWNSYGLILAVIGGVFSAVFANYVNGTKENYLPFVIIYGIGGLFIAIELLYFKLITKKKLSSGGWYLVLYVVIAFASVCLGRAIIAVFFNYSFVAYLSVQFFAEALNFIFALIILFITNRQESVFRDQKEYFLEVRGRR